MSRTGLPRRLSLMALGILAAELILAGRLAHLQVVRGQQYSTEAWANATRVVRTEAPRGRILDRTGAVLAESRPSLTISLLCRDSVEFERRLPALARATGLSAASLAAAVKRNADRLFAPIVVARDVDPLVYSDLAERMSGFPELVLGREPARVYPYGPATAHVLGYVGEVSSADLGQYPEIYRPGDLRGRVGVEAACDWLLRGQSATTTYEVTAEGQSTGIVGQTPVTPGQDVRLTLDADLQVLAFNRLGEAMVKARRDSDGQAVATGGAVVALDPRTGAILVMVSRPSFDPGVFLAARSGRPGCDLAVEALVEAPGTPLLNRAAAGQYAPGSTFKLVTATATLEEGVLAGVDETVTDGGTHRLVAKKCWKPGGHGRVQLRQALAWSCNVYFYEMGLRLGPERLVAWARRFGLGRPTGLDLYQPHDCFGPGRSGPADGAAEPAGTLASQAWKASHFPEDPTLWPAEIADLAIGQGFHAYTPLQMAVVAATIANGGIRWRPYLVDAVLDPEGEVVSCSRPEASGRLRLTDSTLRAVREGLLAAAMNPALDSRYPGTAAWCFGPAFEARWGVQVAGKTGSAEHAPGSGRAADAWFLAYVPYDDPRLVVAVLVEEGGSGSSVAAPVARDIIEAWLAAESSGP